MNSTQGDHHMKKLLAAFTIAGLALLGSAGLAKADPSASECHSISVTINGQSVVDQAGCNVLPPQ
jgi:type 1 fimbria pilin